MELSSRNYLRQLCENSMDKWNRPFCENSVDNGNDLFAMDNHNIWCAVNIILQVTTLRVAPQIHCQYLPPPPPPRRYGCQARWSQ